MVFIHFFGSDKSSVYSAIYAAHFCTDPATVLLLEAVFDLFLVVAGTRSSQNVV